MNGSPVPPPPGSPPPKKGLGPLAWVAIIGCGLILVVGLVVVAAGGYFVKKFADNPGFAAAELAIRANPDLEVLSSDRDKNTITVRNKKTGETLTLNAEDIKNGKVTVTNEKGETVDFSASQEGVKITNEKGEVATLGATEGGPKNLPSWVPVYPGGSVTGSLDSTTAEGRSTAFTVSTQDSLNEVLSFYESKLKDQGLTVDKNTMSSNDQPTFSTLTGKSGDGKREISIMLTANAGEATQAVVTVNDKK